MNIMSKMTVVHAIKLVDEVINDESLNAEKMILDSLVSIRGNLEEILIIYNTDTSYKPIWCWFAAVNQYVRLRNRT